MEKLINGASQSTLSSSINNSQTTLVVASASGFPTSGNFRIVIDSELMLVTGVSGTTFTVTRAQEGTSAASHTSGTNVDFFVTAGAMAAIRSEMYSTGTWASRPSSARTGAIYVTTDSNYLSRYNGSSWDDFGPIFPIVPPPYTFGDNYSWFQQGSATFTRNGTSWILKLPAEAVGLCRMVYKTAPSTPYTIEAGFRLLSSPANFCAGGFTWKQSSNDLHAQLGAVYHNTQGYHLMNDKYNANGSFNSTYIAVTSSPRLSALNYPEFFRITDNGTNRIFEHSVDGRNWQLYHTVGRTDFLTANQIGFGVMTSNSADSLLEIFHYREY